MISVIASGGCAADMHRVRAQVIETVVKKAAGRCKVVGGGGCNCTAKAAKAGQRATGRQACEAACAAAECAAREACARERQVRLPLAPRLPLLWVCSVAVAACIGLVPLPCVSGLLVCSSCLARKDPQREVHVEVARESQTTVLRVQGARTVGEVTRDVEEQTGIPRCYSCVCVCVCV